MALIKQIKLTQFRNYSLQSFDFHHNVVGITGQNGVGKTNLLDAIYYLCFTKSYFQSKEQYNIQEGKDGFRITANITNDLLTIVYKEQKKKISFNNIIFNKLTDFIGTYTAIMIAPDDINLINGASDIRRKFMDSYLSQSDNEYLKYLMNHQKIIAQRNAYLKNTPFQFLDSNLLDTYDNQLTPLGNYIIEKRIELSLLMPPLVSKFYSVISGNKEQIEIVYEPICEPNKYASLLLSNRRKDIEARRSTEGIHTEDWTFLINKNPCKAHASQGQKKSLLISLKLSHLELLRIQGKQPFLLLDDIFEKLDASRMDHFFQLLSDMELEQIFITHTKEEEMNHLLSQQFNEYQIINL